MLKRCVDMFPFDLDLPDGWQERLDRTVEIRPRHHMPGRVLSLRQALRLTQEQFSKVLRVDGGWKVIQPWERGKKMPRHPYADRLERLALCIQLELAKPKE